MAIRSDSFSSVDEVRSFTRHLLDGHTTFDTGTLPTLTEVEKFIDRASALLNLALATHGFSPSAVYGNAVAKLACDDWVTQQAVSYVRYAQRSVGIISDREEKFEMGDANQFVMDMVQGLVNIGVAQGDPISDGLTFTGLTVQSDRTDPLDTTREQPIFTRRQFENNT